ncbi:hypothetical protein FGIG_05821 [Fasciola gigantica]|uniref:Uncharacterized protein n=1 Tax=Fasciola gigantica TaxID=46835 RepID=A0A504Z362_FASGI|nr:hypothetical protein FGIG_05821 [Fasciola gigantica]
MHSNQKTSVADINHKTGNSDGHTQGTRCLHVEVDSPRRADSSSSSPKVDSFRLEPLLLGGVESPGSRRPRQTALDDPIMMVTRDELTGRPPVSYRTTMVSQLPRHFIDDISNSKDRINDSARRGPRRGCSLTESSFRLEEAFRKDLYYTPCVADSSESDANESGSWRPHMHKDLNQKPTPITKSKWGTRRWDKPEWYSDHNTDGEFPSSCPEKESPIQRFTNYNLPASHPQRQRSSPSIFHKLSGYASDSRQSTASRTVTLPEMPSNNQEDMNAPMEAPGRRERSKQFARLKLFFERNSSPKPQSSDSNIRRSKPKPGRRKNTGFKTGDLSGHSSNMEEEQSDLPRLDSVGAQSGPESSPAAINPGYKPPQSSVTKMKRYSRPASTATLSLSPAPPQPITATVTATAVTVTTATATSAASQSVSTTDPIRSQPTGKSQSSISDTVTKLTNSKKALMKEDHEKGNDKPALRGSSFFLHIPLISPEYHDLLRFHIHALPTATYAAPDTIPTREEHLSTSTITTNKSEAYPPTASSMGPKLTQIGFARPKRQKTRAGSRASFSRSTSAVQTTDDEDLFSGSISGWGAQPGDNIPTKSLSHVGGECDGVNPLEDPEAEHIPDLTAFKLIGSIVDSDVDSDTEGRIKIRFRGVPMPGLVGPNAQNMLAEIKQKTHLRSHETRSIDSQVQDGTARIAGQSQKM